MLDFSTAANRRRFFLERGARRRTHGTGAGAALEFLMQLRREELNVSPEELFGDIPFCVVGGVATRAYMPERATKDIDFLVNADDFPMAEERLRRVGYASLTDDADAYFKDSMLGLFGKRWRKGDTGIDLISSKQPWVHDALMIDCRDQIGVRVIALPFLVLLKMDAARGVDQGDLERMLGRLHADEIEAVIATVTRYLTDPQAADDIRQYAALGRLEYQSSDQTISMQRPSRHAPPQL